jgi:hypothetical protein
MTVRPSFTQIVEAARSVLAESASPEDLLLALLRQASALIGTELSLALKAADLTEGIDDIAGQFKEVFATHPPPAAVTHFVVSSYALSESTGGQGSEPELLIDISGATDFRPEDLDWPAPPSYHPPFGFRLPLLDQLRKQFEKDEEKLDSLYLAFIQPALGVFVRAALRKLERPYAVAVHCDDFDGCRFLLE